MAFNRTDTAAADPSATAQGALNHIDMLEKVRDMAINQSATVNNPTIAAGGTSGYAVGDILEIADGAATETFPTSHPTTRANYEVTTVAAGVVTGVRLRNAGVYTALPTNNGTANEFDTTILSGAGVGLVSLGGVLFASNGWTIERETSEVTTATVNAGGSGYVATDTVTLTDSGNEVVAAGVTIDTVDGGGGILTFTINTNGVYDILPATLQVTGGTGTGGILNITLYTAVTSLAQERELILSSMTGDTIVGFRTVSSGFFSWEIAGLPAYVAANSFSGQPNISPGRWDVGDASGSFVILRDTDPARWNWFLNITERRIIGVFNIDTGIYCQMYLGLLNPYATGSEYALPMLVGGCASIRNLTNASIAQFWSGPPQMVASAAADDFGPGLIHTPGGNWEVVRNGERSGATVLANQNFVQLIPSGRYDSGELAHVPLQDQIVPITGVTDTPRVFNWEQFASVGTATSAQGSDGPTDFLFPTPNTPDDTPVLIECVVSTIENEVAAYGELDDLRWIERTISGDTFSAEDEIDVGGEVWLVFNSSKLTTRQHWFVMKLSP